MVNLLIQLQVLKARPSIFSQIPAWDLKTLRSDQKHDWDYTIDSELDFSCPTNDCKT